MLAGMRAVVDCILPSAHTTAEIDRVKDQALIFLISVFGLSELHFLSENTVIKCFAESFYSQPFNAMFVFNVKWHSLPISSLHCVWQVISNNNTTTTVLRPFVRDYPGEPVLEETLTHPPS